MARNRRHLPIDESSEDRSAARDKAWADAVERIIAKYDYWVWYEADQALNTGRGASAFQSAYGALEDWVDGEGDYEEFERLFLEWLDPYIDQFTGRRQRVQQKGNENRKGKTKKVRDRATGTERRIVHEELRAAVLAVRQTVERHSPLSASKSARNTA